MPQRSGGEPNPGMLLFAAPGEAHRFLPGSRAFLRRTRLVNSLLGGWPIVFGSGSWLEAHLVTRLAVASRQPNLRGCAHSTWRCRSLCWCRTTSSSRPPAWPTARPRRSCMPRASAPAW